MEHDGRAAEAPGEGAGASEGDRSGVDWRAVRRAYEETSEPVAVLIRRFGLSHGRLSRRREREGWKTRPSIGGRDTGRAIGRWSAEQLQQLLVLHGMLTGRLAAEMTATGIFEIAHAEALLMQALSRRALMPRRGKRMQKRRKTADVTTKAGGAEKKKNNDANERKDDLEWLRAELTRRVEEARRRGGLS